MLNLYIAINNSKSILSFSKYNCLFYYTNYILSLYIVDANTILIINIFIKKLKNKNIFIAYILYILS